MHLFWDGALLAQVALLAFRLASHIHRSSEYVCFWQKNWWLFNVAILVADVTDVALEWAERNVSSNPHISELIEIRKVESDGSTSSGEGLHNGESFNVKGKKEVSETSAGDTEVLPTSSLHANLSSTKSYYGPPVLLGVLKDGEKLDFCMCNPPFFETMEEAGLNPKTSCGGTPKEMVCPGGEKAFITRMIEDSVVLKQSIRYDPFLCMFFSFVTWKPSFWFYRYCTCLA